MSDKFNVLDKQAKHCDCGRDDCPYCTGAHWDQQYQSSEAGGLRRDLAQLRAQLADLTRQLAEAVQAEREACCAIVLEYTKDIGQTIVSKIRARTSCYAAEVDNQKGK